MACWLFVASRRDFLNTFVAGHRYVGAEDMPYRQETLQAS
jgi:hypothetical protein